MSDTTQKPKKSPGPIRWNAIVPFTIFALLVALYFTLFFDSHLKAALEWGAYKGLGVEVNIGSLKTSFFKANIQITKIEVTDGEKPTHNTIEIGDIRFGMLWDALLRAKIAIEEIAVEGIQFGTKRAHVGRVAPPEPPSQGPGFSEKMKDQFLEEAHNQHQDNVFGNIVALLQGSNTQEQLGNIEQKLASKKMAEDLQKKVDERQKYWDAKFKTLPQGKDFQALNDRLSKVKVKDFKSPQELQQSVQEIDSIVKDADGKYKAISGASDEFQNDLKSIQEDYKKLDAQFKADVETLKQHFKIPKIDAASIGRAVFLKYLSPYIAKFNRYKLLAEKYLPPKFTQKRTAEQRTADSAEQIQVHPREDGKSYEFGRLNAYPLFWLKKISISSKAGASPNAGDVAGQILNISSNQRTTGRPTTADIKGDFPGMSIHGVNLKATLDNMKEEPIVDYMFKVGSYPLEGKELVQGDVEIAFNRAAGAMTLEGNLIGFKKVALSLQNSFSQIDYKIEAKNNDIKGILKNVFAGIPVVTLNASGTGELPKVDINVNTNLGAELQKGFEREINAKIEEAKKRVQKIIDEEIGKHKAEVEAQINKLRSQVEGELKKGQDQLNAQKQQAEQKVNQAKKDAENQAKGALQKEGQKTLDDLKKKLGF